MSTKIKVIRNFTYKGYEIEANEKIEANKHVGKYLTKSDCHYYCEKDILDTIKSNPKDGAIYAIYQISTLEDSNIEDKLIEIIEYKEGEIIIK